MTNYDGDEFQQWAEQAEEAILSGPWAADIIDDKGVCE